MDYVETLIREKALFFAKGTMPEIVHSLIPDSGFIKGRYYIVSIIEATADLLGKEQDPDIKEEVPF